MISITAYICVSNWFKWEWSRYLIKYLNPPYSLYIFLILHFCHMILTLILFLFHFLYASVKFLSTCNHYTLRERNHTYYCRSYLSIPILFISCKDMSKKYAYIIFTGTLLGYFLYDGFLSNKRKVLLSSYFCSMSKGKPLVILRHKHTNPFK